MATLDKAAIATAVGFDPAQPMQGPFSQDQDTYPDWHIEYVVQNDVYKALTVTNKKTGVMWSKLALDNAPDDGTVDATYTELRRREVLRGPSFGAAVAARFPTIDFTQLSWSFVGGILTIDISSLTANQQTTAKTWLAGSQYAGQVSLIP